MTVRIPTHPTDSIRRSLHESGCSVDEFVARTGISRDTASHILSGRVGITPEVALERIGWRTADFWMRRQAAYDLVIAQRSLEGAATPAAGVTPDLPELPPSAVAWIRANPEAARRELAALEASEEGTHAWYVRPATSASSSQQRHSHENTPRSAILTPPTGYSHVETGGGTGLT